MNQCLLTRKQVEDRTTLSRSSIYRLMREADFPSPLRVGVRAVRWRSEDIEAWMASRERATGDVSRAA